MANLSSLLRSDSVYDPTGAYYNPYALGNRPFQIGGGSTIGVGGTTAGTFAGPAPPSTLWGAPNPAYQSWAAQQAPQHPSQTQQGWITTETGAQQSALQQALMAAQQQMQQAGFGAASQQQQAQLAAESARQQQQLQAELDRLQQQIQATSALQQEKFTGQTGLEASRWSRVQDFINRGGLTTPLQGGLGQLSEQLASRYAQPAIRNYEAMKRQVANQIGARGMGLSSASDYAGGQAYGELTRALAEAGMQGDVTTAGLQYNLLSDLLRSALGGQ